MAGICYFFDIIVFSNFSFTVFLVFKRFFYVLGRFLLYVFRCFP